MRLGQQPESCKSRDRGGSASGGKYRNNPDAGLPIAAHIAGADRDTGSHGGKGWNISDTADLPADRSKMLPDAGFLDRTQNTGKTSVQNSSTGRKIPEGTRMRDSLTGHKIPERIRERRFPRRRNNCRNSGYGVCAGGMFPEFFSV